jgi:hypothetical protein
MDPVAIQILEDGWRKDARVLQGAVETMRSCLNEDSRGRLAATAYELNRFFNILEKSFERLCQTFENHFEKDGTKGSGDKSCNNGLFNRFIGRSPFAIRWPIFFASRLT